MGVVFVIVTFDMDMLQDPVFTASWILTHVGIGSLPAIDFFWMSPTQLRMAFSTGTATGSFLISYGADINDVKSLAGVPLPATFDFPCTPP